MHITNQQEAVEAIEAIAIWLHSARGPDSRRDQVCADLARGWCVDLLEAADANGMSGCLLCCG